MSTYKGLSDGTVFVEGASLDPRHDLRNHSPTGFAWGYGGSGPAQLALAILVHHLGAKDHVALRGLAARAQMTLSEAKPHEALAMMLYQKFKFAVIGNLPQDEPFTLTTEQVDEALGRILSE